MVLAEKVGWEVQWYMAGKYIFFVTRLQTAFVRIDETFFFLKENWNHLEYLNNKMAKHVKYIPFNQVKEFFIKESFMCTIVY